MSIHFLSIIHGYITVDNPGLLIFRQVKQRMDYFCRRLPVLRGRQLVALFKELFAYVIFLVAQRIGILKVYDLVSSIRIVK